MSPSTHLPGVHMGAGTWPQMCPGCLLSVGHVHARAQQAQGAAECGALES